MTKAKVLLVLVPLFAAVPAGAQPTREALIAQARDEFSDQAAAQLLLSALDPALGAPDTLWTVAGYELAATLARLEQRDLAATWVRWIVRHAPQWPIDRAWFPPTVVATYDEARAAVEAEADPAADVATRWTWPARFDAAAAGTVEAVATGTGAPLAIAVVGRPASERATLPAGTYTLEVSADGYEPARVTREVLPGVTTLLEAELTPRLAAAVQADVAARIVRIAYTEDGRQVCGSGFVASADGLVLTSYRLVGGRTGVEVFAADGRGLGNVPVAATDPQRDLAVLRLPAAEGQPLRASGRVVDGQPAWSVQHVDCGGPATSSLRLSGWSSPPAVVRPPAPLPAWALGAPLIDRDGLLLGLVASPTALVPVPLTQDVLERARRAVAVQVPRRGGFPWVWAGAGAAAAGIAAVVLGGGGGGNGGGGGPPPPTTGGIIVTFPN